MRMRTRVRKRIGANVYVDVRVRICVCVCVFMVTAFRINIAQQRNLGLRARVGRPSRKTRSNYTRSLLVNIEQKRNLRPCARGSVAPPPQGRSPQD